MSCDRNVASTIFVSSLRRAYHCLKNDYSDAHGAVLLEYGDQVFLGVRSGLQGSYSPRELRHDIEIMLQVSDSAFIEVVGDSSHGFSSGGINAIHAALSDAVAAARAKGKMPIIEYGYTANRHDLNWAVNDWLTRPAANDVKAVGNIVYASARAVEEWHCEATVRVNHFVLAYSPTETGFGEDTWISDPVLIEEASDLIICAEGGPQAFYQVATVCGQGIRAIAITGPQIRKAGATRFSAAALLKTLVDTFRELRNHDGLPANLRDRLQQSVWDYVSLDNSLMGSDTNAKHPLIAAGLQKVLENPASLDRITIQHV